MINELDAPAGVMNENGRISTPPPSPSPLPKGRGVCSSSWWQCQDALNGNSEGRSAVEGNHPAISAEARLERKGPDTLPLDQTFPRLLYELAVRLPALREIQAVCVWLYEPVRH